MGFFSPSSVSNEQLDRDVASGRMDAYNRTDNGGIQKYYGLSNGDTLIKDVQPANNPKGHNTTEFTVRDGRISDINPHSTNY